MMRAHGSLSSLGVAVLIGLAVSGCVSYTAPQYAISTETVQSLRAYRGQVLVTVGEFTATEPGRTGIMCRGAGPIEPPVGLTYEAFLRKALVDELVIAEVYAPRAPILLTGHLDAIDFSSAMTGGTWTIAMRLRSSNGRTISLVDVYPFSSSFVGDSACQRVAQALVPAVQSIVGKLVRHPGFASLIQSADAGEARD